ncbi:MAG: hypothetical protein ACM31L_09095 [Actinomycetota bacterium]
MADQPRTRTDAGDTGDKIRAADPAAAPMSTDSESAGTPIPRPAAIAAVRQLAKWTAERMRPTVYGAARQPADAARLRHLGFELLGAVAALAVLGVVLGIASWPG